MWIVLKEAQIVTVFYVSFLFAAAGAGASPKPADSVVPPSAQAPATTTEEGPVMPAQSMTSDQKAVWFVGLHVHNYSTPQ